MKELYTFKSKSIVSAGGTFTEAVDSDGKTQYFYETELLPFGRVSRNGVRYNEESARENGETLIGKNLFYNHITSGNDSKDLPRGEWVDVSFDKTCMRARAEIFNVKYNEDFLDYLKVAKNPRSSLQVTGNAKQMKEEATGKMYREAYITEFLEASVVGIPGFDSAKGSMEVAICEAFNGEETMEEDMQTKNIIVTIEQADNGYMVHCFDLDERSVHEKLEDALGKLKEIISKQYVYDTEKQVWSVKEEDTESFFGMLSELRNKYI